MLNAVIKGHSLALKPGGFMVINIADILCFPDPTMPRFQAANSSKYKCKITKEEVLEANAALPYLVC